MQYKKDFPIFKKTPKLIYLDSGATSQKPQVVINTVNDYYTKYNSNIHRGLYDLSTKAENIYEGVRKKVADFINTGSSDEIVFTSNTTESINLVAFGYFQKIFKKGDIIVLSDMEHHSNIVPWLKLKKALDLKIYYLPITNDYKLDYQSFRKSKIHFKKVKLISLTHASNVLGTINPLEKIIPSLTKLCPSAKILIDTAQSVPHIKVDVRKLHCDLLTFSSHKMFGPSGVGILWAKKDILEVMDPLLYGGHMIETVTKENATYSVIPQKFEAGTGKLEGVSGLGTAIDYINSVGIKNIQKYENILTKYTLSHLHKIKGVQVYGPKTPSNRLPVFSFNIINVHPHDAAEILNRFGICVRAGHHCAQLLMNTLHTPSGTLRASLSIYNTKDDIDKLIKGIKEVKNIFKIK